MDPTVIPAEQALEMATIGGARVLGMQNEIGSLEEGKRADFITLSLKESRAVPLYDVHSFLAYAAHSGDIEDVFVNGRQLVADRNVLTIDRAEVFHQARIFKDRILATLKR